MQCVVPPQLRRCMFCLKWPCSVQEVTLEQVRWRSVVGFDARDIDIKLVTSNDWPEEGTESACQVHERELSAGWVRT